MDVNVALFDERDSDRNQPILQGFKWGVERNATAHTKQCLIDTCIWETETATR